MPKFNKYVPSIVGFVAIVLVSQLGINNFATSDDNHEVVQIQKFVEDVQSSLPSKIDNFSTVTALTIEDKVLTYEVTLDGVYFRNEDIDKIQARQFAANVISACRNPLLIGGLTHGLKLEYAYSVATSEMKFRTSLEEDDCIPFSRYNDERVADYYVGLQNNTVPLIIDTDTTVIYYERVGETIEIVYQLHNWKIENLDVAYFVDFMNSNVVPDTCLAPDYRALSERGFSYTLKYYDSQFKLIHEFLVDSEYCQ